MLWHQQYRSQPANRPPSYGSSSALVVLARNSPQMHAGQSAQPHARAADCVKNSFLFHCAKFIFRSTCSTALMNHFPFPFHCVQRSIGQSCSTVRPILVDFALTQFRSYTLALRRSLRRTHDYNMIMMFMSPWINSCIQLWHWHQQNLWINSSNSWIDVNQFIRK